VFGVFIIVKRDLNAFSVPEIPNPVTQMYKIWYNISMTINKNIKKKKNTFPGFIFENS